MKSTDARTIEVNESSQVNEARRLLTHFAREVGLDEAGQNRLALISAELATNLVKHSGRGGNFLYHQVEDGTRTGVELYSMDNGRGLHAETCLVDGYSTSGTLGTGLGAVRRLSDEFGIQSTLGSGTVVHSRIWSSKSSSRSKFSAAGLSLPKKGELISGDKWFVSETPDFVYSILIDGLGHGIEAAEAAQLAVKKFRENISLQPDQMIKAIHGALRGSRGAVGAVARIDKTARKLDYCGLGNIAGIICLETERKHLTSLNGTLGYEARKVMQFSLPWSEGALLVMHSDGLSQKTFNGIADVETQPAAIIAGWLFKQFAKDIDDATILVLKQERN